MSSLQQVGQQALEVVLSFDGAVLNVHHLRDGQSLTLGPAAEGAAQPDYALADLPAPIQVATCGPQPLLCVPQTGSLEVVQEDGSRRTLADLRAARLTEEDGGNCRYALPPGAAATIQIAALTLQVRQVLAPLRTVGRARPDYRAGKYMAASFLLHGGIIALALLAPPDPRALASQDLLHLTNEDLRHRFVPAVVEVQPPVAQGGESGGSDKRPMPGKAGMVGPPRPVSKVARTTAPAPVTKISGQSLRDLVSSVGLTAVMGSNKGRDAMKGLTDRDASALGSDAETVLAGLVGTQIDPGSGTSGASLVATGPGSGGGCEGPDCGTIAAAPLSRVCTGTNCGDGGPGGPGKYRPGVLLRTRKTEGPVVGFDGQPHIVGGLDKELIRRVIRSRMNEFKYCYERQLVQRPELAGRVVMSFLIGKDGRVMTAGATQSTLADRQVESCLSQSVQRLSFPQPQGGGSVQVSYPFVFHSVGQ